MNNKDNNSTFYKKNPIFFQSHSTLPNQSNNQSFDLNTSYCKKANHTQIKVSDLKTPKSNSSIYQEHSHNGSQKLLLKNLSEKDCTTNSLTLLETNSESKFINLPHTTSFFYHQEQVLSNSSSINRNQESLRKQILGLKKQNENLNKELNILKGLCKGKSDFSSNLIELQNKYDKAQRALKELEKRTDICYRENILYKEIIEKLQRRIEGLLNENSKLNQTIKRSLQKLNDAEIFQQHLQRLKIQYLKLEEQFERDNQEWEYFKEVWVAEKEYYKEIIRKLEFQLRFNS